MAAVCSSHLGPRPFVCVASAHSMAVHASAAAHCARHASCETPYSSVGAPPLSSAVRQAPCAESGDANQAGSGGGGGPGKAGGA
eukprot:5995591-Prymnesium_polylepis.1